MDSVSVFERLIAKFESDKGCVNVVLIKRTKATVLFPFFAIVCPQIMDIVKEAAHNLCQSGFT